MKTENRMLLQDKTAIVYGAGGAIGGAVARACGAEGARVFLSGRTLGPVEAVAQEIAAAGGSAEAAQVDALGTQGVRVVCLRPHRIDGSGSTADPRSEEAEFRRYLEEMTLLKRLPTLAEVASTAVFLASDHAASMTGAVATSPAG